MAIAPTLPDSPREQRERPKPRTSYLLVLALTLLGCLLFGSLLLLDAPFDATGGRGAGAPAAAVVRLRSWAGGALGMAPADGVASSLLLRAQASLVETLSGAEASELLLAGLLAPEGEAESRDAVRRSAPLVRALASGGTLAPPGTCHCLPALFLLATCRHWGALDAGARRSLQGIVEDTVRHLESRVGQRGALDSRGVGQGHHAEALGPRPLLVSSLAQVQAMAALRCAGTHLLPSLTEASQGLVNEALVAAERLRRGLADLHLARDEAGDEEGPYDVGSALPASDAPAPMGGAAAAAAQEPPAPLRRVRRLTSQLPMMLLFLDDGDVPPGVMAAMATAALRLASPVGLALWAAPGGAPGGGGSSASAWRVSPQEQALIVAGALKHMLPAARRARVGLEEEESGDSEWAAADALLLLVDAALRCAAPLARVEREAAERSMETLGTLQQLSAARSLLVGGGVGGLGMGAGAAAAASPASAVAALAAQLPALEFARALEQVAGGALTPTKFQALQAAAALFQQDKQRGGSGGGGSADPAGAAGAAAAAAGSLLTASQAEIFLTATAHSLTFPEFITPLWEGDAPLAPRAAPPPMLSIVVGQLLKGGAAGLAMLGLRRKGSQGAAAPSPPPPPPGGMRSTPPFSFPTLPGACRCCATSRPMGMPACRSTWSCPCS